MELYLLHFEYANQDASRGRSDIAPLDIAVS